MALSSGVATGLGDDANADKVSYEYDSDYRLEKLKYYIYNAEAAPPAYEQVEVEYDYDTFGRLETIEDRLGLTSTYAYNDDHTLKSLTLPNGTATDYTYDDLRRLVSIATTGLNASDIIVKFTYEYNDLGLRDKVTMADGRSTEWSYDDVGRLVQEHFKSGAPSPTTLLRYVYTYDAAGNRTAKKTDYDSSDGNGFAAIADYTVNGYNQLTAVDDAGGTVGRGTRVNVTGTIPTAWTLTGGDVEVTPNGGDPVEAEVRGRFFIARQVPLNDSTTNSIVASTSATTLAGNSPSSDTTTDVELDTSIEEDYTYNANGDLTQKTEVVSGTTIQWDYTYDVRGWLTKVEKKVGGQTELTEEYFYDPVGRKYKVSVTEDQTTTTRYFVYDGGSIVLELELDSGNYILEKEHVRGASLGGGIGGLLYTRDAGGSVGYFHYDGQGNVVSVTSAAREEIAYYEYDAWGNVLTACGSLANEFAFSTKQASTNTGLIDFGFRWYDPQTGQWSQRDPVGVSDTLQLYAYLNQSPLNSVDWWGLEPDSIFARLWACGEKATDELLRDAQTRATFKPRCAPRNTKEQDSRKFAIVFLPAAVLPYTSWVAALGGFLVTFSDPEHDDYWVLCEDDYRYLTENLVPFRRDTQPIMGPWDRRAVRQENEWCDITLQGRTHEWVRCTQYDDKGNIVRDNIFYGVFGEFSLLEKK